MRMIWAALFGLAVCGCGGEPETTTSANEQPQGQVSVSLEELAQRNQRSQWLELAVETCGLWYGGGLSVPDELQTGFRPMSAIKLGELSERAPVLSGAPQENRVFVDESGPVRRYRELDRDAVIVARAADFDVGYHNEDAEHLLTAFAFERNVCAAFSTSGEGKGKVNDSIKFLWDNVGDHFERRVSDRNQGYFKMDRNFSDASYYYSEYRLRQSFGGEVFGFFYNRDYESGEQISFVYISTNATAADPFSALFVIVYPG